MTEARWKRVERQVAKYISSYMTFRNLSTIRRKPILGRTGPDLTVNELGVAIDVKSRVTNPVWLYRIPTVATWGDRTALRLRDFHLIESFETNGNGLSMDNCPSKVIDGYLEHMEEYTNNPESAKNHKRIFPKSDLFPSGLVPAVVVHIPNTKIGDSVFLARTEGIKELQRRLSNLCSNH